MTAPVSSPNPVPTPVPTPTPALSTKFTVGQRVAATANINVRSTANTAGTLLGTQPTGRLGTVTGGPVSQGGYNWWNVNYDSSPDGWSVEDFLVIFNEQIPTPTPTPTPTPVSQTPYLGTPVALPGTIQAENFDNGGQGVSFNDSDTVNNGGQYRTTAVDIKASTDTGGGYSVGWTNSGEWLEYTVNVPTAGSYNFDVRVATPLSGKSFHIEIDGVNVTGSLAIPVTGAWDTTYTTISKTNVALTSGQHVMKIVADTGLFDVDYVRVSRAYYLSDLTPTSVVNGWGPYEKDKSNGEEFQDGLVMRLNGTTYTKGIGAHAASSLTYNLGGKCSAFISDIGVDDEIPATDGTIIFQVYLDNVLSYNSGVMNGATATKQININTTGKNLMRLVITDAGDGIGSDHGDWAGARVNCTTTPN